MKGPHITMVSLGVRDLPAAVAFYEQGLGFESQAFSSSSIAFFEAGGTTLGLYGWDALAEDAQVPAAGSGFRGVTLACNLSSSREVLDMLLHAEAAGGSIVKPAEPVFWGGFSGYFADLDGHLWEVAVGAEDYARKRASE